MTELLALDEAEVPLVFVPVIVKVYAWLAANVPVTVKGEDVPLVDKAMEGEEVVV